MTTQSALRVHIRWMIRRDMAEVLAIDSAAFSDPWGEEDYLRELRSKEKIGMVAEAGDDVVGAMLYELRPRQVDVLRFAVAPSCRAMGVGRQMAAKLAGKLSVYRRTDLFIYLRESNLGGQLFFRRMGYRAIGVERGYFADTTEDGYLLRYSHGQEAQS